MSEVRLVILFKVRPRCAAAYAKEWAPHRAMALADDGCLQYELFESLSEPDSLILLELWRDRQSFDAHWAVELKRTPAGAEQRNTEYPTVAEIYWNRAVYRWRSDDETWEPRA